MNKELQDRAWAALPKETRKQIRQDYLCGLYNIKNLLMDLFGLHNLTSATEPEEMLCVKRKDVMERIKHLNSHPKEFSHGCFAYERADELINFFGDKCLPDKTDVGFSYRKDFDDGSFFEAKNGEFTIVAKNTPNLSNSQKIGKDAEKKSEPADTQNPFKVGDFVVFKHCINVFMITDIRGENVVVDEKNMYSYHLFDKVDSQPKFKVGDKVCVVIAKDEEREILSIEYDKGQFWYHVSGKSVQFAEKHIEPYQGKPSAPRLSLTDEELDGIIEKLTEIRENRRASNKELSEMLEKLK